MLTLFDYLRQRAFESVIDGTQDALEYLENQKGFDQRRTAEDLLARRRPGLGSQEKHSGAKKENSGGAANHEKNGDQSDEQMPPPRRRGRPRKNEQSNK